MTSSRDLGATHLIAFVRGPASHPSHRVTPPQVHASGVPAIPLASTPEVLRHTHGEGQAVTTRSFGAIEGRVHPARALLPLSHAGESSVRAISFGAREPPKVLSREVISLNPIQAL